MAMIQFWEKPRCVGNAKQKKLLEAAGHALEVRDLLSEGWTPQSLRPFFGELPVGRWFNRNAPQVKSGQVDPESFGEVEALELMCKEPLLIRRPLMQVGKERRVGFEVAEVEQWLGSSLVETTRWEKLGADDMEKCSHPRGGSRCD